MADDITIVKSQVNTYVFVHNSRGFLTIVCEYCDRQIRIGIASASAITKAAEGDITVICESCRVHITDEVITAIRNKWEKDSG